MKRFSTFFIPLVLSGCSLFGGTQNDATAFCSASGDARIGDIYHVTGHQDFWLTPSGQYLSDNEYSAPKSTLDNLETSLQNTLQGTSDEHKNAEKVRIFRVVASRDDTQVKCLTVKYGDADKSRKFATLKTGQRLRVLSDSYGKSGQQMYQTRSSDGFNYQLIK